MCPDTKFISSPAWYNSASAYAAHDSFHLSIRALLILFGEHFSWGIQRQLGKHAIWPQRQTYITEETGESAWKNIFSRWDEIAGERGHLKHNLCGIFFTLHPKREPIDSSLLQCKLRK